MGLIRIDHVQLAMPEGREEDARHFYKGLLGLAEVEKPANLKKRGGCWFEKDGIKVHLGVEKDFRPARKGVCDCPGGPGLGDGLTQHYTFVHFPFLADDFLHASMKAMPATPSSMPGNMTSLSGFLPERRATMARAASL